LKRLTGKRRRRSLEIRKIQTRIAEREAEYNSTEDDISLGPQLAETRQNAHAKQGRLTDLKTQRGNLRY
jgi:hypothetical protein